MQYVLVYHLPLKIHLLLLCSLMMLEMNHCQVIDPAAHQQLTAVVQAMMYVSIAKYTRNSFMH